MKINHLIIGSNNVEKSADFYCELFGFKKTSDNPGAEGGQVIEGEESNILILPFGPQKLPSPVHLAFESKNESEFYRVFERAQGLGLVPRSDPSKNSKLGFGEFTRGLKTFKQFYVSDPSGINVELMVYI